MQPVVNDSVPGAASKRLWRVEADAGEGRRPPFDPADWRHQGLLASGAWDALGRWFTERPEILAWYAADVGPRFRVVSVALPPAEAERWRVSRLPRARAFSKDPLNEFFLPRDAAEAARRDPDMEETVRAEAERVPAPA